MTSAIEKLRQGHSIDWMAATDKVMAAVAGGSAISFAHGCRVEINEIRRIEDADRAWAGAPGTFLIDGGRFLAATGDGIMEIVNYRMVIYARKKTYSSAGDFIREYGLASQGTFTSFENETFEASRAYSKVLSKIADTTGLGFDHTPYSRAAGFERDLIATFGLRPGTRMLDLACASGWFAYLMGQAGMDSYGADLMGAESLPPEIRGHIKYFRADAFDLPPVEAKFDLVFIRNFTVEHEERTFTDPRWQRMFAGLADYLSETGSVYWIMMNSPLRIPAFEAAIKDYFPFRHYRCCGYHAAILSRAPFQDHRKRLTLPASWQDFDGWTEHFESCDIATYLKALHVELDKFYRFLGYALRCSLAVDLDGRTGEYMRAILSYYGYFTIVASEAVQNDPQYAVLCWDDQARRWQAKYPEARIFGVSKRGLIENCINPGQWLVSKDQDTTYFSLILKDRYERVLQRSKAAPQGEDQSAPPPAAAGPAGRGWRGIWRRWRSGRPNAK